MLMQSAPVMPAFSAVQPARVCHVMRIQVQVLISCMATGAYLPSVKIMTRKALQIAVKDMIFVNSLRSCFTAPGDEQKKDCCENEKKKGLPCPSIICSTHTLPPRIKI